MTSNRGGEPSEPLSRLPLDGLSASWTALGTRPEITDDDQHDRENLTIGFENEAWTVQGIVSGIAIHYVVRMSAMWRVQQMLLFRDLDEPDLWLANDGTGRWGEINGAQRRELGGCEDIDISCSAFLRTLAIRRLALAVGESHDVHNIVVDPETLEISRTRITYTHIAPRRWSVSRDGESDSLEFDVDEYGLPLDLPGLFRRTD